jgi:hypothetical protein
MRTILFGLLLFCSGVCFAGDALPVGKVIGSVSCRSEPSQSYALYIPEKGRYEALPIVYFFDPHGDGSLPVKKYSVLADLYGFILAGSNNSKNGNDWAATEKIWRCLSSDTKARLKINASRVYTCGFSGGAKAASYLAIQHPGIKGVIVGGAGLPDGVSASDLPFSITAIAGEGDMNMTELVALNSELDRTRTRHRILFFDGKHEWASENTMRTAFAGWVFDAMFGRLVPKDNAFIARYIAGSKQRLGGFEKSNRLIKALQECQFSSSLLDGVSDQAAWFTEKAAAIGAEPDYRKQQQAYTAILATEQNTKAGYMAHFGEPDRNYWTRIINDLSQRADYSTALGQMNQRLLAYLSLAFYSLSNRLITANANAEARPYVELYKLADPTNSEAWYLSALLNAREGRQQAAENDLKQAVHVGFNDKDRFSQQPEFKNLPDHQIIH